MVSEYARGPAGWVVQLAFLSVAVSCWALAAAVGTSLSPGAPVLLSICGLGFAGAGVFVTDPVSLTEPSQTRSGAAHVLFAFATILLFPITATIVDMGLSAHAVGPATRIWLYGLTGLTWFGFVSFFGAALYSTRRAGTPLGYFERVLILTYSGWLIAGAAGLIV